jgi:hypothetical protein
MSSRAKGPTAGEEGVDWLALGPWEHQGGSARSSAFRLWTCTYSSSVWFTCFSRARLYSTGNWLVKSWARLDRLHLPPSKTAHGAHALSQVHEKRIPILFSGDGFECRLTGPSGHGVACHLFYLAVSSGVCVTSVVL